MRWLPILALLVACGGARDPRVARADLERVPAEWRDTFRPAEDALRAAAEAEAQALAAQDGPRQRAGAASGDLRSAERAIADAEADQKAARKASDPVALAAATERRSSALAARVEAERALRVATAEVELEAARHALRSAERRVAATRLELIRAQAAADAGAWVEVQRFAEVVVAAEAGIAPAEERVRVAESAVVLAGQ
jgi:hypothetical protein